MPSLQYGNLPAPRSRRYNVLTLRPRVPSDIGLFRQAEEPRISPRGDFVACTIADPDTESSPIGIVDVFGLHPPRLSASLLERPRPGHRATPALLFE